MDKINVREEMGPAALVNIKRIHHGLLRSDRDLATIEIEALLRLGTLEPPKLTLIGAPLVRNRLATLETADWNDHAISIGYGE